MRAEKVAASLMHGEHSKRRAGAGEKFWQFRPYDASDRPQDIDWKQSAKGRHVFVREKEWQTAQRIMFWCSAAAGMEYSSNPALLTKHETGLVISLALALLMTRAGEHVAALGNRQSGRSGLAIQSLAENLLGKADFGTLPDAAALPGNASLVMVGDFMGPLAEIEHCFAALEGRTRQVILIQILDPAEIELPFEGRGLFRAPGLEGHAPIRIDHIGDIRAQYQKRIKAHCEALETLVRRYGWLYALHRTDHDEQDLVSALWDYTQGGRR
jgi:uncharacterized protein (DUF58 family)